MKLTDGLIEKLKEKGFDGDCICCAVDWFREKHNIFIQYYWMIDQEAGNRVVWYFKIEYIWDYKEPYKETKIEKWNDDNDACQLNSIEEALALI